MAASPEHRLQAAFFDWARLHPQARRAYAVPNGGLRSKATAGKMKAEGVRAGVLDVHLPLARGGCHGLWIEHKAGRNPLSKDQEIEAKQLAEDGYAVAVVWDDPELSIKLTMEYLNGRLAPGLTFVKPEKARKCI